MLDAGHRVSISSGRDTTLAGAQVSGHQVAVDAGRNLTITSQQDRETYDSKQQSTSAGVSIPVYSAGSASVSLNASRDKMHSDWQSVQEQSGIFAGDGGFDVTVGNHTQLNGGMISGTGGAEKNRLDTGTLGFGDIHNQADYKTEHQGAGLSSGGSVGDPFTGNMANALLAGMNGGGHEEGTTQSAVSESSIVIREGANQKQSLSKLSRDTENANGSTGVIFDKEREQSRQQQAQLIAETGSQVADIARTEGEIAGLKAQKDPAALSAVREQLTASGKPFTEADVAQRAYNNAQAAWGTSSAIQQGIQAATAAVQGLAGGNLAQALTGAAAPYIAEQIHKQTQGNQAAQAMAHAVVAQASGNSALAGAVTGEVMAQLVMKELYPGRAVSELTESEKQTLSALGTLAAGLADGLLSDSTAGTVAGAQAGKNSVENNFLSAKDVLNLHKELEEADKIGADKQGIYGKYAEISKKNRDETVAESCSGNPFCANGTLAEVEGGTDIANSLRRLPIFSDLSSDELVQLNRFALAENEDSARAIYQAMPDYVKLALNGKEAVEAIGLGAAVGGKSLAALGVVGKVGKPNYTLNKNGAMLGINGPIVPSKTL